MAERNPHGGSRASAKRPASTVITNAKTGTSREMASREKRYAITMGIRTACFVSMLFVSGNWRWVFLAGAVFLPYLAVLFANQADTKSAPATKIEQGEPTVAPQLTVGPPPAEVIDGELVEDDEPDTDIPGSRRRGAHPMDEDDRWASHDRVA